MSIEFIVSVIVLSVSVWLVIDPCWKFGTTGTAMAGAAPTLAQTTAVAYRAILFFIFIYHYRTVSSDTNCVVTVVPAPPAVGAASPVAKP